MSDAPVPITRPSLGDAEVEAATRVIRSGWIMLGPEVAAFETELARAVGAAHAVAVSNGTVALELALRVLGVGPGDDVLTVSHSFIATANAVLAVGARPVFVDVERDTLDMDAKLLEAARTPATKAVLCVHQVGLPCDLAAIGAFARRHGLAVVEDAACAIGSEVEVGGRWERIGRPHGALACFSFHPRKVITTGDGGMITTADEAVAKRLRLLRNHGMASAEEFTEPAFNYRLTDVQAAIGRPQLARLDAIIAERRRIAARYIAALEKSPVLVPPRERPGTRSNWQSFPVFLREGCGVDARRALEHFQARGVSVRGGIMNAHETTAYADRTRWLAAPSGLAVSEELRRRTILLPLFHGMTGGEEGRVLDAALSLGRQ